MKLLKYRKVQTVCRAAVAVAVAMAVAAMCGCGAPSLSQQCSPEARGRLASSFVLATAAAKTFSCDVLFASLLFLSCSAYSPNFPKGEM